MWQPRTLFARTATVLSLALILSLSLSVWVFNRFVMTPISWQAAEDAAALLVLSSQTWAELPPHTRDDFADELRHGHGLDLTIAEEKPSYSGNVHPQMDKLQYSLSLRLGRQVKLGLIAGEDDRYAARLPVGDTVLSFSFPLHRFVPEIPAVLLWMLASMAVLTLVASLVLVRQMTRPLALLGAATQKVGQGDMGGRLAVSGPEEIQQLTHSFNLMTSQVQQLLNNRTTLLAGVSHDLRTPIARLQLALEMLPPEADPQLQNRMRKDLNAMDTLIGKSLELARGVEVDPSTEEVDLREILDGIVVLYRHQKKTIHWDPGVSCHVTINVDALNRVVGNLLDNAFRYAGDQVELKLRSSSTAAVIEIADSGEGIPEADLDSVFEPFKRLESSRNEVTGGSGLGLAIVRQIVDANGWTIVLSNRPHGGLCAQLSLPMGNT